MQAKELIFVLAQFRDKKYWTRVNSVEFIAFMTKLTIIIPGLLFNKQWWWLYVLACCSSASLVWSSTKKTLPTILVFNMVWVLLAAVSIVKQFTLE